MRNFWIFVILAGLLMVAAVYGGQPSQQETGAAPTAAAPETTEAAAETTAPPETAAPPETTEAAETTEAVTEPVGIQELFLTVAEIHFSVVGEQEDIYIGTAPREQITWSSDDPSIVSVEDGVLTAQGVGTTRVTASWQDQELSCIAGCLAEDADALHSLHINILRSPKRIVPQVPDDVLPFFSDAAMVGDSSTVIFMKRERGRLGSPRFLGRTSLGLYNQVIHQLDMSYKGMDTPMEDVIADVNPGKVFILLGTNDVRIRPAEDMIGWLEELLNRIQEKNPDVEIYLQSLFPFVNDKYAYNSVNENMLEYNERMEEFAREHGHHYVPITPYLVDHIPGFAREYQQDEFHPSEKGVDVWIDALKAYAYVERLKGEWS